MFQLTKKAIEERSAHRILAKWYQSYLRSNTWKRKCILVAARADHECEVCGNSNNCVVHHLTYSNVTKERSKTQLQYLCQECHKEVHHKKIIPFAERIYDETYMKVRIWN